MSTHDAQNLPAGITSGSSGTREASDRTNDTFGKCQMTTYPHSIAHPPPSTIDWRLSTYMNACNTQNLPTGITRAGSGTCEASNQTNDTLGECRTSSTQSITHHSTQTAELASSTHSGACNTINLPTCITSGSSGTCKFSSTQHDNQTPENSVTGVQWLSSGPLENIRPISDDASKSRCPLKISMKKNNIPNASGPAPSAYKLKPEDSALSSATAALMCICPNHLNPVTQAQTQTVESAPPQPFNTGLLHEWEDGEIVEWEPISLLYELAAPADSHFKVPTLTQFWGYSWQECLFLHTLARNFTIQPCFCNGLAVSEWLQEGRYTTGIDPEG